MKGIRVDPPRRTVRAEGGVTLASSITKTRPSVSPPREELYRRPGSQASRSVGNGYLARKHGLACDNLLSVDLVTAEGELVIASATENPDLFWGVRGGGGNFGVVTSFDKVHPIGEVLTGFLLYPVEDAERVLKFFESSTPRSPTTWRSIQCWARRPTESPSRSSWPSTAGRSKRRTHPEALESFWSPACRLDSAHAVFQGTEHWRFSLPSRGFRLLEVQLSAKLSDECSSRRWSDTLHCVRARCAKSGLSRLVE